MKECCRGGSVFANPECVKSVAPKNTRYTHFSSLSPSEQQAFCDFQFKELHRHQEDIDGIEADLKVMKERYGIEPRRVYIGSWLEVDT